MHDILRQFNKCEHHSVNVIVLLLRIHTSTLIYIYPIHIQKL